MKLFTTAFTQAKKTPKKSSGFTLPEILIVVFVFLIILLIFLTLLSTARVYWEIAQVRMDLYQNARKAMREIRQDLIESGSGAVNVFSFNDPINGEWKQGLIIGSGRGNPEDAPENILEGDTNYYLHLNANNAASWRSVIIYCPYETDDGEHQLRRYVDYGPSREYYEDGSVFPVEFAGISALTVSFNRNDGTAFFFNRDTGRVAARYVETEDTNNNNVLDANEDDGDASPPMDNADGFLNYGFNVSRVNRRVDVILFLRREVSRLRREGLELVLTLRDTVLVRQP